MNVKYALIGLAFLCIQSYAKIGGGESTQSYAMEKGMSIEHKKELLKKLLVKKAFANLAEGALFGIALYGFVSMGTNFFYTDNPIAAMVPGSVVVCISGISCYLFEEFWVSKLRNKISTLIDGMVK